MRRTLDATAFNLIANEPTVRPWLGGREPLDLTSILADVNNFAFLTDDEQGGYIYVKKAQGLYEVHTLSLPTGRGREMLNARSASLREMFTKTDAVEIVTMIPDGNRGAAVWASHAGFREVNKRSKVFDLMGEMVDVTYASLSYADWAMKDKGVRILGEQFHRQIHEQTVDDHGEDPAHDGMVGATAEGCLQQNAEKAILLYNRWASHMGYELIKVLSARPLVLDIRSCIVQLDADGLQVLHVRERPKGSLIQDDPGAPDCPPQPSPPLQA